MFQNVVQFKDYNVLYTYMDIPQFEGGWSYTQKEMNELFKHIVYTPTYAILEFGSGASTFTLYDHFKKHVETLLFDSYESNTKYYTKHKDINMILYDENNIANTPIRDIQYDLILVDGPNGDKRSQWYSKIRSNVKPGTILLVDDFNHFPCFSEELDRNFNYELLSYSNEPPGAWCEHSWKIVRIINAKGI